MPYRSTMQFIYKVLRSFLYAFRGIWHAIDERNMKVHVLAAGVVVGAGFFLNLSRIEWCIVLLLIAAVWSAEMVNTAVEELANIVRDELKLTYVATQRARDVAAGAVLIFALVALVISGMIFLPKILELFAS